MKETLPPITFAMFISQNLVHVVNGKVVYLFKIADQLNSKLDVSSKNLNRVDNTFSDWQAEISTFLNSIKCREGITMKFLSKYTAEIS